MKVTSKIFIVLALVCLSAAAAYSQDCNSYLKQAAELVSQKKYCDAKRYYQRYSDCDPSTDVSSEIAMCERFCNLQGGESETVSTTSNKNTNYNTNNSTNNTPPVSNMPDIITLKDGSDIQAKVTEIGENEIKYKKFENQSGPAYTMKKVEIFMIRYANGSKDVFADASKSLSVVPNNQIKNEYEYTVSQPLSNPYLFRFYLGAGSGHSYGGVVGSSLEARFNNFAFLLGGGFFPDVEEEIGWAVGIKWYWGNMYWNSTIGTIGQYTESGYCYNYAKLFTGGSELIGFNWSWGSNVRFGINVGIGFCYGFSHDLFSVAYDLGISISFGTR